MKSKMRTLCGTILGAMVVASAQAKMEAAFGIGNSRYDGNLRGLSPCAVTDLVEKCKILRDNSKGDRDYG